MKLIIAGSRDFDDMGFVAAWIIHKFRLDDIDEIVSGGARGVDACGEQFARMHGIPVKQFPAQWDLHGRAAGPIRNAQMAKYGDVLIAFSSGGRGTANMISTMRKEGKPVHIVNLNTAEKPVARKTNPNQAMVDRFARDIERRVAQASGITTSYQTTL
jgi:cysteine synthase